jgi:hypothetical protein
MQKVSVGNTKAKAIADSLGGVDGTYLLTSLPWP